MLIKKKTSLSSKLSKRFLFFAVLVFVFVPIFNIVNAQTTGTNNAVQNFINNTNNSGTQNALNNSANTGNTGTQNAVNNFVNTSGQNTAGSTGANDPAYQAYVNSFFNDPSAQGLQPKSYADWQATNAQVQADQNKPGRFANTVLDALKQFILWLANGILWLFSWVVWLGATLLKLSLEAPTKFGGFTKSAVVVVGWPIVRDLANMFFALILLVISFATILRIETYGMKQVLWRLVVAALLINFSLVIAGVIVDGSNILTNFFTNAQYNIQATGQTTNDVSEAILNGLKLNNIYNIKISPSVAGTTQTPIQGDPGFTTIFLNVILGTVFMLITAFVFFAAAVLFYIRMIALWILLIFAPLAWLAMILPATRSIWSRWWHEFTKWIIFAPVYGFFIYLTVSMLTNNVITQSTSGTADASGLPLNEFFQNINMIQSYIILSIFMLAGLIFARQSGIIGANTVTSMGKAYGRFFSRWAARGGKVPGATWAAQKLGVTQRLDTWQKEGTGFQKGLANIIRGAGKVKSTAVTAMSPQVWSRYWAYREQRANAASFDVGAGRLDGFVKGLSSWRDIGSKYDSRPPEEKNEMIEEEAKKIENAMYRGEQTYRTQDISISNRQLEDYYAAKGIPEPTASMTPTEQQNLVERRRQAERDFIKEQSLEHSKTLYERHDAKTSRRGLGYMFEQSFGKGQHEQIAETREVSRRQQEFGQTLRDEDQIVDYYMKAKDPVDREALFRLIASINGLNTLFARMRTDFNPKNLSQYMQQNFRGGRAEVLAADVSAMAAQNGNFSFVGTTAWDASKGKIRFATEKEQTATAVRKSLEMEAQTWARMTHPDSWINRDANGQQKEISAFAKEMLNQMTGAHIKQLDRFQGRTLTALYNFRGDFHNYINTSLSGQQQQIAKDFMTAVENRYVSGKN